MSATKKAALIEQFSSADDAACEAAAVALGEQGAVGLAALAELLFAAEADARFWAVRGLWANGSLAAVKLLLQALSDGEEMVRSGAALALGELKAEAAVEALAALLAADPAESGSHAADALAKIGQPAAGVLIKALQDERPWVRVRAAKALVSVESNRPFRRCFKSWTMRATSSATTPKKPWPAWVWARWFISGFNPGPHLPLRLLAAAPAACPAHTRRPAPLHARSSRQNKWRNPHLCAGPLPRR